MEITIRDKNPGPQVNIVKNGTPVMESGKPQTDEQIAMAQGKAPAPKGE